jgi:hypothetical protein
MTYLIVLLLIALVLGFLFYGGRTADDAAGERGDEVDREELEQAEREVQEAEDEDSVRDWGPGTTKP